MHKLFFCGFSLFIFQIKWEKKSAISTHQQLFNTKRRRLRLTQKKNIKVSLYPYVCLLFVCMIGWLYTYMSVVCFLNCQLRRPFEQIVLVWDVITLEQKICGSIWIMLYMIKSLLIKFRNKNEKRRNNRNTEKLYIEAVNY